MCVNPNDPVFYVYVYLDPRKPGKYVYGEYEFDYEPFYVGKGNGKRAYAHLKSNKRNEEFFNKIKEICNPIIIFYAELLNEYNALTLEDKIIRNIGRLNIGTGPLFNKIESNGTGTTGRVVSEETRQKLREAGRNISEETRQKRSKSSKGKVISDEQKNQLRFAAKLQWIEIRKKNHCNRKISIFSTFFTKRKEAGKNRTEEQKEKTRIANIGRKHSKESKKKMSDNHNKYTKSWNKGKTGVYSKETLKKMSDSHKKYFLTHKKTSKTLHL
jgi:hypothetical protein